MFERKGGDQLGKARKRNHLSPRPPVLLGPELWEPARAISLRTPLSLSLPPSPTDTSFFFASQVSKFKLPRL